MLWSCFSVLCLFAAGYFTLILNCFLCKRCGCCCCKDQIAKRKYTHNNNNSGYKKATTMQTNSKSRINEMANNDSADDENVEMMMMMLSKSYCLAICLRHELFIQIQDAGYEISRLCEKLYKSCNGPVDALLQLLTLYSKDNWIIWLSIWYSLRWCVDSICVLNPISKCLVPHLSLIPLQRLKFLRFASIWRLFFPFCVCVYQYSDGNKYKCLFTFSCRQKFLVRPNFVILIH